MAVVFKNKSIYSGMGVPCFQVQPAEREVFGFALDVTYPEGFVIPQGTPLFINHDTHVATVCKYGYVVKKTSAKIFVVNDVRFIAVGDKIVADNGEVVSTISAIDEATKTITLSANNAELDVNVSFFVGTDASTPNALPNAIVARSEEMKSLKQTINATQSAVAIKNVLKYPSKYYNTTAFPGSVLLVGCPSIRFVNN